MARRRKKKRQFFDDDSKGNKGEQGKSSGSSPVFSPRVADQIEAWADEAAQASDLQLWDVEVDLQGRWIIRVYVDLPGMPEPKEGVGVDDLAAVSRYIEAYLDASDAIPERYVLEVSSPGVERKLKTPEHLRQAVGENIQLVVRQQIGGKNKVIGELLAFDDGTLTVRLEDNEGEPVDIDWANVKKARLKYDFDF